MAANRHSSRSPLIGLDIGSFAVRAAELSLDGGRPTLQRFGQVSLPVGAVKDGEILDAAAVSHALSRLWSETGFSSRRVVVGVSSQRVIIRQADVARMSEDELRSSLGFQAQELIPIPVEEAVLDFSVVPSPGDGGEPSGRMPILLAAAQREMVNSHLAALKSAGLEAVAVDPAALALLRAVPVREHPDAPGPRAEAVVSVGQDLTTIAVREGPNTRFVRVVNNAGSDITEYVSAQLAVDTDAAEDLKRRVSGSAPVAVAERARTVVASRVDMLVEEIRGSLDYYLAQSSGGRVNRIVVTGGGAQTAGLLERLQASLGPSVEAADPLTSVEIGKTGLSPEQLDRCVPYLVTPLGLALWGGAPGRAISLLPPEVIVARRHRRQAMVAGAAVASFALVLGGAWGARSMKLDSSRHQVTLGQQQVARLQGRVNSLSIITKIDTDVAARQDLYRAALQGDVDWVRLLEQVSAVMPRDVYLSTFTASRTPAASTTPGLGAGTVNISGVALGGHESVANWLRSIATLPSLQGAWVSSETSNAGSAGATGSTSSTPSEVSFSSSATITSAAGSTRARRVPGAPQ